MKTVKFQSTVPAPVKRVFEWHERRAAFERLVPPWIDARLEKWDGVRDGDIAKIRLSLGPLRTTWTAEHRDYISGRQFRDIQVDGPFRHWDHLHRFDPVDDGNTRVSDEISYEAPGSLLGRLAGSTLDAQIKRQFAYRHRVLARDLLLHERYGKRRLRVAVTGSGGLVGSALVALLRSGGHEVRRVVRRKPDGASTDIFWDISQQHIEVDKLEDLDAVVHLAGEPIIAARWTEAKKTRIYESRVQGTTLLAKALTGLSTPPRVFAAASAIGYYGDGDDEWLDESSAADETTFLARVCRDWEAASAPIAERGARVAHMRLGMVLSPGGGALKAMLPAFRVGAGGPLGNKRNYVSWIALDDVIGAIYHVIGSDVSGPVNLTAPEPVTMHTFAGTVGRLLNRPAFLGVPGVVVEALTGEMGREVLLASARVRPGVLEQSGYDFGYAEVEEALAHVLGETNEPLQ